MKNFCLSLVCLSFFLLTSCKKNYTCVCVSIATVEAFGNKPNVITSQNLIEARTLKKAKSDCEIDSVQKNEYMEIKTNCEIK